MTDIRLPEDDGIRSQFLGASKDFVPQRIFADMLARGDNPGDLHVTLIRFTVERGYRLLAGPRFKRRRYQRIDFDGDACSQEEGTEGDKYETKESLHRPILPKFAGEFNGKERAKPARMRPFAMDSLR